MLWIADLAKEHALRRDGRWEPLPLPEGGTGDGAALVVFLCAADANTFVDYMRHAHDLHAVAVKRSETMTSDKPMRQDTDLDGVSRYCPCGAAIAFEGDAPGVKAWMATHRPHCNGTMVIHITPDGHRAVARPQPDETVPLDEE